MLIITRLSASRALRAPATVQEATIACLKPAMKEKNKGPAVAGQRRTNFLLRLGPGLITGAADDDPSGIATYSQVGAQFGMGMLWTMLFSFPLMATMQEICARLGRITGADITAMGAAGQLLLGGNLNISHI